MTLIEAQQYADRIGCVAFILGAVFGFIIGKVTKL